MSSMSAFGQQTFRHRIAMSALPPKANIQWAGLLCANADIGENESQNRFLLAKSLSRSLISVIRIACCGRRSFCNLFWLMSA